MAAYTLPQRFLEFGGDLDFSFNIRGFYNSSTSASSGQSQVTEEEIYGLTTSDGTLVLGSELAQRASDIKGEDRRWTGHWNDSEVFPETSACKFPGILDIIYSDRLITILLVQDYQQIPWINFEEWDEKSEAVGEGLFRTWTGYVQDFSYRLATNLFI